MSLDERTHYMLRCDACGRSFGWWDATKFAPQDVLTTAVIKYGWSIEGDQAHCADCPVLCSWCRTHCDGPCMGCSGQDCQCEADGDDDRDIAPDWAGEA